eukprot:6482602-Karenia_brevis.AAC.1
MVATGVWKSSQNHELVQMATSVHFALEAALCVKIEHVPAHAGQPFHEIPDSICSAITLA